MTEKQKQAIKEANRALKNLHKSGVLICGMDNEIIYATKTALDKLPPSDSHAGQGEYCEVARAAQSDKTEETGFLYSKGYLDSGGW